jgi:hypothetical protein
MRRIWPPNPRARSRGREQSGEEGEMGRGVGGSRGGARTSTSLPLFPSARPPWCPEAVASAAADGRTTPIRSCISREKMIIFL